MTACATMRRTTGWRWKGSTAGLSQQPSRSWGQPGPGSAGPGGSSPDNAGTGWHRQTARVRQARQEGVTQVNQCQSLLSDRTDPNLVDMGRVAAHTRVWRVTPEPGVVAGWEATGKDCGVPVAMLQGQSWAPHLSTGCVVNVGTVREPPSPLATKAGGGQARCRLSAPGRDGALVVVRGRESRPHGEGGQQVRSPGTGTPGGRR
jgi:hypothetical protein